MPLSSIACINAATSLAETSGSAKVLSSHSAKDSLKTLFSTACFKLSKERLPACAKADSPCLVCDRLLL